MLWFDVLTAGGWLAVVLAAGLARGNPFAIFVGVLVGIYSLLAVALAPWDEPGGTF